MSTASTPKFPDLGAFLRSLNAEQRRFFFLLQDEREQALQDALVAGAATVSTISALLSDAVTARGSRNPEPSVTLGPTPARRKAP